MVWTCCSSLLYHKEEDFICLFVFVCLDSKLSTLFFLKLFWANKQTSLSWQDFVYSCQTHSLISWIHFYCLHFIKLPWKKNIAIDHEANSSALCSCWLLSLPSPQYHQKWALPSQDVGASTGRSSPFPVACMLILEVSVTKTSPKRRNLSWPLLGFNCLLYALYQAPDLMSCWLFPPVRSQCLSVASPLPGTPCLRYFNSMYLFLVE